MRARPATSLIIRELNATALRVRALRPRVLTLSGRIPASTRHAARGPRRPLHSGARSHAVHDASTCTGTHTRTHTRTHTHTRTRSRTGTRDDERSDSRSRNRTGTRTRSGSYRCASCRGCRFRYRSRDRIGTGRGAGPFDGVRNWGDRFYARIAPVLGHCDASTVVNRFRNARF